MDRLGKIALVGGTGMLLGAAIQKASDIREERDRREQEKRDRMEAKLRDQAEEIERLKRVQDNMLDRRT